ncbi:MAG: SRPBCC domain-containing protein [Herbiconiux sp.]|uniref:SRPBCC family protein n=1 Tax=Herbiconiux sp. TaxID=1871186 RepID=UPI0012098BBF|nr:SRPBCC domain-containing protein [Herbiconiux sp.]TAJ46842.1 MAG: SRPBCC domain-containing protein [Herbiconiux sp.]
MTVISSHKDPEALTLTFVAEFDAPVERVWQVWEDPRQLERWWGPPTWPATFTHHDFVVGGESHYFMTGPDGTRGYGWWRSTAIDAPTRYEFEDGFSDENAVPIADGPVGRMAVTIEPSGSGCRMTTTSHFDSLDDLDKLVAMGMEEGMKQAQGQIDDIVASA